jgi:hypothetical protein
VPGKRKSKVQISGNMELNYMTEQILELAAKLQYITNCDGKINVLIDNHSIEVAKEDFIKYVHLELEAGKTLVSSIRDVVFKRVRFSEL